MEIVEETEKSRFVGRGEAEGAELSYRAADGNLEIVRTFTPPRLRGRGIAADLMSAAVERARQRGETIVPTCWYARQWIEEHPDETVDLEVA